jgi:hypothetical protein
VNLEAMMILFLQFQSPMTTYRKLASTLSIDVVGSSRLMTN